MLRKAMRLFGIALSTALLAGLAFGGAQSNFDPDQNIWTLSNGWIRASFQLTPEGFFLTQQISDLQSGDQWAASGNRPTSPVRLQADSDLFDAQTRFFLVAQYAESVNPGGIRQFILLQDVRGRAQITVVFDLFDNHPVLRYSLKYKNLTAATTHIAWINMVPWTFDDLGKRYTAFRVNQWSVVAKPEDFQPLQTVLDTSGSGVEVYSGADGQQCGWLALRDSDQRGLFTGWEFDGRTKTTVRQNASKGYVQFSSTVLELNHPVESNGEFQVPNTFIGLFHGDWDEAGYRTQRFVESVLAEADASSPVLRDNPDWSATDDSNYFGAKSLCLSNQPAQDWLIQEAIRMIDEYHVDWILQDGQNMVKQCTKTTHTHDPADSNYANAVQGINAVVSAIQQARPNVFWENCENGGNMMTFNMVKSYVTSITNDASGSLPARKAVYGATYPFPPRYAERYMPESDGFTAYATHSYRFGGPWGLMTKLADLQADQVAFLKDQIQNYKNRRLDISAGKVFHILAPAANATDAIQSYNEATDTAIAVVTRAASNGPTYLFRPRGLQAQQRYTVRFEIDPAVYSQTGAQLMTNGFRVMLPKPYSSEVVHIEPQP